MMPKSKTRLVTLAFLVVVAAIVVVGVWTSPRPTWAPGTSGAPAAPVAPVAPAIKAAFVPPQDSEIPDDGFGAQVRLGRDIFNGTSPAAAPFVGNTLRCASCHLDSGRLANSAPLWGAYVLYPAFRAKNGHVNTFQERVQGCFRYSMNGKPPPLGHPVLIALESYAYFLARGAPVGVRLPGQGYPKLPPPALGMDYRRGQAVYEAKCAFCHGADGQGQASDGATVFPALWGPQSYNWGAGMSDIRNAAAFIQANMPLSQGGTLSGQEAWDVAAYIDSQVRPQDPRYAGSLEATRAAFHSNADSMYGLVVNGRRLGAQSTASR